MKPAFALVLMGTAFGAGPAAFAAGLGLPLDAVVTPNAEPGATPMLTDSPIDDADCDAGTCGHAARAGTVAPPQNGHFTDGTAPVVMSN